jgi:hypothetical protein
VQLGDVPGPALVGNTLGPSSTTSSVPVGKGRTTTAPVASLTSRQVGIVHRCEGGGSGSVVVYNAHTHTNDGIMNPGWYQQEPTTVSSAGTISVVGTNCANIGLRHSVEPGPSKQLKALSSCKLSQLYASRLRWLQQAEWAEWNRTLIVWMEKTRAFAYCIVSITGAKLLYY